MMMTMMALGGVQFKLRHYDTEYTHTTVMVICFFFYFHFISYRPLTITGDEQIMISHLKTLMRCSPLTKDDHPPDDDTPCSGRGECQNGTCLCEIRYAGDECSGFNLPYHAGKYFLFILHWQQIQTFFSYSAGVSSVFYFVALVSIIQLLICIVAEYQRLKQPSLLRACRITTQKLLYFVVFIAATLRGAYFTTPVS